MQRLAAAIDRLMPTSTKGALIAKAVGAIVVFLAGAYVLALMQCECGLISIARAAETVLPYGAFEYFLLIPLLLMLGEILFTGWRNSSLATILRLGPSVRADGFYLLLQSTVFMPAIIAATTGGLFWHLNQFVEAHSLRLGVISNPILQCAAIFVVGDFVSYWVHRWSHASPALWEAHKVHHSATELNLMVAFRFHPLEKTWLELANMAMFLVLGATTTTYVTFSFVHMLLGQIQHSRADWTFGPLGKVLVSPMYHRFHHSVAREDHDKNFGARLTVWDMMFGTYSPKLISADAIGVSDNTYVERSLAAEFFRPYYVWVREAAAVTRNAAGSVVALARGRAPGRVVQSGD